MPDLPFGITVRFIAGGPILAPALSSQSRRLDPKFQGLLHNQLIDFLPDSY